MTGSVAVITMQAAPYSLLDRELTDALIAHGKTSSEVVPSSWQVTVSWRTTPPNTVTPARTKAPARQLVSRWVAGCRRKRRAYRAGRWGRSFPSGSLAWKACRAEA
jgi:hypothetical protein